MARVCTGLRTSLERSQRPPCSGHCVGPPVPGESPLSGPAPPAPAALARWLVPQGTPAAKAHSSAGHRTRAGLTSKAPADASFPVVAGFLPRCLPGHLSPLDHQRPPSSRRGSGDPWWQPWALRQDMGFLPDPRGTSLGQEAPLGRLQEGAGAGWAGQLSQHPAHCRWPGATREAAAGRRSLLAPRHPQGSLSPPPSTSDRAEARGPSQSAPEGTAGTGHRPGPNAWQPPAAGGSGSPAPGWGRRCPREGPGDAEPRVSLRVGAVLPRSGLPGHHHHAECPGSPPGGQHDFWGCSEPGRQSARCSPHNGRPRGAFTHLPT